MAKITDTPGYTTMPNQPPSGGSGKVTDMPGYTTMPNKPSPSGPKPLGPKTPGYTTLPNKVPPGAGSFTKPAPNPFKPQQGVRPATPADRGNNSNRLSGVIGKVGDYLGNIGQNVRDVGTAAGTNIQIARNEAFTQGSPLDIAGTSNFMKQAKEVAGSLIGRPGTRSDQYKPGVGYINVNNPNLGEKTRK